MYSEKKSVYVEDTHTHTYTLQTNKSGWMSVDESIK